MRRKRIISVEEYLYRRCWMLRDLGGDLDHLIVRGVRTGDEIVLLDARVLFPDSLELKVFEVIERTSRGGAHRRKYSYQARWRERLLIRYDREPIRHPEMPEHRHLADGTREPCDAVGIYTFANKMWAEYERARVDAPAAAEADADVA